MKNNYRKHLASFLTAVMCMNVWSFPASAEDFAEDMFIQVETTDKTIPFSEEISYAEPARDEMAVFSEEENTDFADASVDFDFSENISTLEDIPMSEDISVSEDTSVSEDISISEGIEWPEEISMPEYIEMSETAAEELSEKINFAEFDPDEIRREPVFNSEFEAAASATDDFISMASATDTSEPEREIINGVGYILLDGKAIVAGCDNTFTTLVVQDYVKGCPVIGITPGTFGETVAKEIILPSTLEWIDNEAFRCAFNLTSITIPAGVKSIGSMAFYECYDLKTVTFENTNSMDFISGGAFADCRSLTSINLPKRIPNFGESMFVGCNSLKNITLPSNLTEIPAYTFAGCTSLTSVDFPTNITEVGKSAFERCSSFTAIKLPDTVTALGQKAFAYSGIASFTIPSKVTKLPYMLFYKANNLTSITIPANVKEIDDNAFYYCQNLASVTFKNTNVVLQNEVFTGTPWERSHNNFVTVGDTLISYVGKDTNVTVPAGIKTIGKSAFIRNETITSVTLPAGVTTIEEKAFDWCVNLTTIKLPTTLVCIDRNAFSECKKLKNITLPSSLTSIGSYAFDNCHSLTSITIPSKVTRLEDGTFEECSSLASVTLPDTLTYIGNYVFTSCIALKSISLPASLTNLEKGVFYRTGLTSVILPAKITKISTQLFQECADLTSVTSKGTITEIGAYAFCDTPNAAYTIPSTVTRIGAYAFAGNSKFKELTLPAGLTTIGNNAFVACNDLTSVTIPGSVQNINSALFYNCQSLKNVTLGKGIKTIGEYAFYNCSQMEMVEIPSSVTQIDNYAFGYKRNDDTRNPEKIIGFSIKGTNGSTANTYAVKNGFLFNGVSTGGSGGVTALGKPVVTVKNNDRGILISISPMEKVSEFRIYSKVGYGSMSIYNYSYIGKVKMNYLDLYSNHETGRYLTYKIVPVLAATGKESTEFTEVITMVMKPVEYFSADSTETGVQLSWKSQDCIDGYEIFRKKNTGNYQKLTTIKNSDATGFLDKTAADQTTYSYMIRSYSYDADDDITYNSIFTNDLTITYEKPVKEESIIVGKPTISGISNGTNSVKIQWGKVSGVTGYEVYRKAGSGVYGKIAAVTGTSYEDKSVEAGKKYTYKLLACVKKDDSYYYSEFSTEKSITTPASAAALDNVITANDVAKKAKASAQTFTLAAAATGGTLQYSVISTTKLSGVSGITDSKVTVDSATGKVTIPANFAGTAQIRITAGGTTSGKTYKTVSKTITLTVKPIANTITAPDFTRTYAASNKSFSIGATRKGSGAFSYSSSTKSVSVSSTGKVTVKEKFIGKATITVKVAACGIYKAASKKITVTVNPTKTALSTVSKVSGQKMKVTWKKNASGTGYEIQYSTSAGFKSGTKTALITKNTTTAKTFTGLTKGKTCYVRIRTYKTVGGTKYYSGWSAVKSVK